MPMSRRGILGGTLALGAAALSGCSLLRGDLGKKCAEAAEGVDGVTDARLTAAADGGFSRYLSGTVRIDAEGEQLLHVFDEALRAIITTIHDFNRDEQPGDRRVDGVTGVGTGGDEVRIADLIGEQPEAEGSVWPTSDGEKKKRPVTASTLYGRYGLR